MANDLDIIKVTTSETEIGAMKANHAQSHALTTLNSAVS